MYKIFSVEPYVPEEEWAKKQEWVKVKVMFNGNNHIETRVYKKKEWEVMVDYLTESNNKKPKDIATENEVDEKWYYDIDSDMWNY